MFEDLKNCLYAYYLKNHALGRKHIFEKFKDSGAPKRTLNHWISLLEQCKPFIRKEISGRSTGYATPMNWYNIKKIFNNLKGCSQKMVDSKLNIGQQCVSKILNERTKVKYLKRTVRPKMT